MPQASKPFRTRKWKGDLPCRQYHRLYCNGTWERLRISFLSDNPLCVVCLEEGVFKMAKVVDHIKPHKGNTKEFFDLGNLQSLCKRHHDKKTYLESRA